MKLLLASAALAALIALPAHAQLQTGAAGVANPATPGGITTGLGGAVGGSASAPLTLENGNTAASVGAASRTDIGAPDPNPAAGPRPSSETTIDDRRGAVTDGRSLAGDTDARSASTTSANASASVRGDVTSGMMLRSRSGETLGKVVGVSRNRSGQITKMTIQTADGVRRSVPPAGLSVEGDAAVTAYSTVELNALPRVR